MRILVAGLPRSGTTYLYSIILNAIPGGFAALFEPTPELLNKATDVYRASTANGIVKIVLTSSEYVKHYAHFNKNILLVRDPRDNLISTLLYSTLHCNFIRDPNKKSEFLALLRKKEQDPKSVTMQELIAVRDKLEGGDFIVELEEQRQISLSYHAQNPNLFVFSYNDLVEHKLKPLEDYLGFQLNVKVEVPQMYSRVRRAARSVDWPDWFLAEDLTYFKPLYQDYLNLYRLSDDWAARETMKIEPRECSEYVEKLINEALIGT